MFTSDMMSVCLDSVQIEALVVLASKFLVKMHMYSATAGKEHQQVYADLSCIGSMCTPQLSPLLTRLKDPTTVHAQSALCQ